MTFTANFTADGEHINVRTTYGPITIDVVEHPRDLRHFWGQLGHMLVNPDGKSHGQRAYEAYHASAGGKSVHGEELPGWDDQHETIREHWERAAAAVRT